MRASKRRLVSPLLRSCAVSALAMAMVPALALAATPPLAAAPAVVIKHLPAGHAELTFTGENATRSWAVPLARIEAARTSTFQLAMLNAISTLPERSTLTLSINGTVLATVVARQHDEVAVLPVRIPTGLLVPGDNIVQVSVVMAHRVDCSVAATYELWTLLDPAKTGFVVPIDAAASARTLDDLATEPLADDGTTRIHVRRPEGASDADLARAARFMEAVVRRARLVRPIVDVGPQPGRGPGLDIVLDRDPAQGDATRTLKSLSQDEGVIIGRDPSTDRLVLILAGADDGDIDRQITALSRRPASGGSRLEQGAIAGGTRRSLAQMGFATERFAGRHYMAGIDVTLPSDFYPANDRARLLVDGAHSAALDDNAALVFRVNGTLVSTMPMAAGRAERFQHAVVELPLRFFHPGHNQIAIEGMTPTPADGPCDMTSMPRETRLTIAGSSELEFPNFARLVTLPQIPAALSRGAADAGAPLHLYLPGPDLGSLGAGLTVLANMATGPATIGTPVLHVGVPSSSDVPGILIAPAEQLPVALAASLHRIAAPTPRASSAPETAPAAVEVPQGAPTADADASAAPSDIAGQAKVDVRSAVAGAEALLRSRGFFFTGNDTRDDALPAGRDTMLVAAVAPEGAAPLVGGIEVPTFLRDPAQWLVITAPTARLYEAGLRRLVADGDWARLDGQAVSFDVRTGDLRSVQPTRVSYVLPGRVVPSDMRPILGGIVSNNIRLSIAALLGLLTLLGVSTHLLVRRSGHRQS